MLEFGDQVTVVTPATLTNSNQRKDETLDKGTFDPLWHTNKVCQSLCAKGDPRWPGLAIEALVFILTRPTDLYPSDP